MKLTRRLRRVEQELGSRPCLVCAEWPAVAIVGVEEGWEEGDPVTLPHPAVCPRCGRRVIAVTLALVGVDPEPV